MCVAMGPQSVWYSEHVSIYTLPKLPLHCLAFTMSGVIRVENVAHVKANTSAYTFMNELNTMLTAPQIHARFQVHRDRSLSHSQARRSSQAPCVLRRPARQVRQRPQADDRVAPIDRQQYRSSGWGHAELQPQVRMGRGRSNGYLC